MRLDRMAAIPSSRVGHPDDATDRMASGGSKAWLTSQKARVVLITNILPPYRLPFCRSLVRRNDVEFEIWLMATHEKNRRWLLDVTGLPIRTFPDDGVDFSDRGGPLVHFNPGMLLALWRERPTLTILGGYDSATNGAAAVLLKILRIPFLFWIESTGLERDGLREVAKPLLRLLVRSSEGVIVPGLLAKAYAFELAGSSFRVFVSPNSVDVIRFAPRGPREKRAELRKLLDLPDGVLFLYVGRLNRRKGVIDLIESFSRIASIEKNAHLILVGDGPLKAVLSDRTSADPTMRGRIHLKGHCSEDDLPRYYTACDVFVFPTHRDPWGLVINEAMSSGLPVIATDHAGATRDLLENGVTGYVIAPGDKAQLTARMQELLENEALRVEMGKRARETVMSGFTPEIQAKRMLDAVRAILASEGG